MENPGKSQNEAARAILGHVAITPGVCEGKPYIVGRQIKVAHIVTWHERMWLSPKEIVSRRPELTLADVHAALAYYWDHREQIEPDIRKFEAVLQAGLTAAVAAAGESSEVFLDMLRALQPALELETTLKRLLSLQPEELGEVLRALDGTLSTLLSNRSTRPRTEEEFEEFLVKAGTLTRGHGMVSAETLPDRLVPIQGKPLSQTIIEERR